MHFEAIEAVLREFELLIYLLLGMCLFFFTWNQDYYLCTCILYDRCWYPFIYLCIYICKKRKSLNGTIAIDSPFKTLGVDFLSNL